MKTLTLRRSFSCGAMAILAFASLSNAMPRPGQSPAAQKHLEDGQQLYLKHKYGKAAKELEQSLSDAGWSKTQLARICLLTGKANMEDGKLRLALEYAGKSVGYDNTAIAHYYIAEMELRSNQPREAMEEIDLAISLDPRFAPAYTLKGDVLSALSGSSPATWSAGLRPALESYKQALELSDPKQEGYAALKDRVDAIEEYLASESNSKLLAFTPPKPLNRPRPDYTDAARNAGIRGAVRLIVQVLESGNVGRIILLSHLGYGLDEAAIKAARKLKFSAATIDGKPAAKWVLMEVDFNLG